MYFNIKPNFKPKCHANYTFDIERGKQFYHNEN